MKTSLFIISLLVFACLHAESEKQPPSPSQIKTLTPAQAVFEAANLAPDGVQGVFELTIRASGEQNGMLYLNSERDYRDQRNLTIAIPAQVRSALAQRLGFDPKNGLLNKRILVSGVAERVTICFFADGKLTNQYYYQTHVKLRSASQLEVAK